MKKLRFLISLRSKESGYQRMNAAAARDAAIRLGIEVQVLFAGNDAIAQSEQLLKAIQSPAQDSRPNGILCSPVGTPLVQVARSAAAAGIGWAILSRDVDYIEELRCNFQSPIFSVLIDHSEVGRIQANQMATLLPQGGTALYLVGPTGNPITEKRLNSMLAAKPINIQVKTLTADWTQEGARQAVARWLPLKTSVNLVAAQNDEMAVGAKQAIRHQAPDNELESWMGLPYLGAVCCPDTGPKWIREGLLTASIIKSATADVALEMMVGAIKTKTQPPERTLLAPTSYPEMEKLGERRKSTAWISRLKAQELALRTNR